MAGNIGDLASTFNENVKTGYSIGGGKNSGLASALAQLVANMKAKQDNQATQDSSTQLLGVKGLMEGKLQPTKPGESGFGISGLQDSSGKPIMLSQKKSEAYSIKTDPITGEQTITPVAAIDKGDKFIPPPKPIKQSQQVVINPDTGEPSVQLEDGTYIPISSVSSSGFKVKEPDKPEKITDTDVKQAQPKGLDYFNPEAQKTYKTILKRRQQQLGILDNNGQLTKDNLFQGL